MIDRIRVLLVISDLRGGGAEREFVSLAQHLSRDRFEVQAAFWRPTAAYALADDVEVHMVPKDRPWHVFRAVRGFRRLIDEIVPDVVFSQLHYVNMVMGSALARTSHRPAWVCRFVNDPRRDMPGPQAIWARRSVARADRVLGASAGVARALIEHLRLDPERVGTMANAVDVAMIERRALADLPIPRPEGHFIVVHAGRLVRQKNQAVLLRAFQALGREQSELWVLGEGELRADLKRLAVELGIKDRVRWLGFQDNPYPFFRAADCLALTSDHEGLPNVIIESMICGTPVVSTACDYGPGELIEDGSTGFLTPVGDAAAFGHALDAVASDRARAHAMGDRAARQARRRFDTATVTADYERQFERLAGARS
jgi:glycosyltransferase involved in cell wall biosynthesis